MVPVGRVLPGAVRVRSCSSLPSGRRDCSIFSNFSSGGSSGSRTRPSYRPTCRLSTRLFSSSVKPERGEKSVDDLPLDSSSSMDVEQLRLGGLQEQLEAGADAVPSSSLGGPQALDRAAGLRLAELEPTSYFGQFEALLYTPVSWIQEGLGLDVGVSWPVIAICIPFIVKAVLQMPLAVRSQLYLQRIGPKLDDVTKQAQELSQRFQHDQERLKKEFAALVKKTGINPLRERLRPAKVALALAPVHVAVYFAFRNMDERFPGSWGNEGMLWFPDLGAADPYWLLPMCIGGLTMTHLRIMAKFFDDANVKNNMHLFGSVLGGMSIPLMHIFGAGFNLYCASNIVSAMAMGQLLRHPAFRDAVGLKQIVAGQKTDFEGFNIPKTPEKPKPQLLESQSVAPLKQSPVAPQIAYVSGPAVSASAPTSSVTQSAAAAVHEFQTKIQKDEAARNLLIKYGLGLQVFVILVGAYGYKEYQFREKQEARREERRRKKQAEADDLDGEEGC